MKKLQSIEMSSKTGVGWEEGTSILYQDKWATSTEDVCVRISDGMGIYPQSCTLRTKTGSQFSGKYLENVQDVD